MSVSALAIGTASRFVAQIADPTADAPAGLKAKVDLVLGIVKYGSLAAVLGLLLASGMISLAGDRGYGGGMSPGLKSTVQTAVVALVLIGSAAQLVDFLS